MPAGEVKIVRQRVYDNPRPTQADMRANLRTVVGSRVTDESHLVNPNIDPLVKKLIRLRLEKPMSCEGLQRRSETTPGLKISSTAIRKWERGASSPSLAYLRRWCQLLGKNLEQICAEMGQS